MKPKAVLKNWARDGMGARVLWGNVYGHSRLKDGAYVHTSTIIKLDEEAKTCETLNTLYTLGDKA